MNTANKLHRTHGFSGICKGFSNRTASFCVVLQGCETLLACPDSTNALQHSCASRTGGDDLSPSAVACHTADFPFLFCLALVFHLSHSWLCQQSVFIHRLLCRMTHYSM